MRRLRAHRRRVSAPAALLLALTPAACGDSPAPDGAPAGAAAADGISLVEELRVGGLDGPEELTFGYIYALAPTGDGGFYAYDGQIPVIRRYDAQGNHLGDVGRGGEGPGEYRQITAMKVLDDGRLATWDPANKRVSLYGEDGTFLESWRMDALVGAFDGFVFGPGVPGAATGEGSAVGTSGSDGAPGGTAPLAYGWAAVPGAGFIETADGLRANWVAVDADGETEVIHPLPPEDSEGPRYVLSGRGGYYRPFTVMTLHTLGPDGSYYEVRNDEYRIRHLHPDGTETFITRDEPRIELTPDETREWTARSESMLQRPQAPPREQLFPIPDTKPYIRHITTDADGRLWVSRYTEAVYVPYTEEEAAERAEQGLPSYNWRDHLRWDVFAPDDRYLGSVTFPFRTTLAYAEGDEVWGIQAGPYREDYVVRFRMER